MEKWIYKVILVNGNRVTFVDGEAKGKGKLVKRDIPFLHDVLNQLAEEGWEPTGPVSHYVGQLILRKPA